MARTVAVAVAIAALYLGPRAAAEDSAGGSLPPAPPLLGLGLGLRPELRALAEPALAEPVAVAPRRAEDPTPPPCVADWCQPRVELPGVAVAPERAHKTELFVALLDRAQLEPLASVAWFFVVTGLRADWTPPSADPSLGATRGGWGNVFVRLRLRVDAWNRPAVPTRPRDRMRQERQLAEARELSAERELAAERERARALERLRALAGQRPARLSST